MVALGVTFALVVVVLCIVLPIVAIVRTSRIRHLEQRLAGVEAALLRLMQTEQPVAPLPVVEAPAPLPPPVVPPAQSRAAPRPSQNLETVIGQKWIGWIAVILIFCAAAFFLKYAVENQWIGELGRVTIGVLTGLGFAYVGLERYRKGWRYLSQVLTGGGITILYLSVFAAFGYYHLVPQSTAFAFLVILVALAHLLAVAYDAKAIAVMALVGGFLTPMLLSTGHDQYRVLFGYIAILDIGFLGIVLAKRWQWIGALAYAGSQLLFWGWYSEHYHPEKRIAALVFQTAIFLIFLLASLAPHFRKTVSGWEEWIRLAVNPFIFYATCYSLLNGDHHDWMAVLALGLGIVYAGLARLELGLTPFDRRMLFVTVGTALTFATIAIPVQLDSNWITIAWGIEAVVLLWAALETRAPGLRTLSAIVFGLAVVRFVFEDTPWSHRAPFTPIFNRYFLATLALGACFAIAIYLQRRAGVSSGLNIAIGLLGVGVLWLGCSVEAHSYFEVQAAALSSGEAHIARQLRWAGQLSLSVLWSVFAGLMTAAGFRFAQKAWRIAGLVLFGITLFKVVFSDMSELEQFYRIVAFLALGLILLGVAWGYQRVVRREQAR